MQQADRFVDERHRHRYEVNPTLVDQFEAAGLRFVGKDESGQRMEVVELSGTTPYADCGFHSTRLILLSMLHLSLLPACAILCTMPSLSQVLHDKLHPGFTARSIAHG